MLINALAVSTRLSEYVDLQCRGIGYKKSAVVSCEIILTHVSACDSNLQIFLQKRAFENKEN